MRSVITPSRRPHHGWSGRQGVRTLDQQDDASEEGSTRNEGVDCVYNERDAVVHQSVEDYGRSHGSDKRLERPQQIVATGTHILKGRA